MHKVNTGLIQGKYDVNTRLIQGLYKVTTRLIQGKCGVNARIIVILLQSLLRCNFVIIKDELNSKRCDDLKNETSSTHWRGETSGVSKFNINH